MFKFHNHYFFESINHKICRRHFEMVDKLREIEECLCEIGLHNNYDLQHLYIKF